MCIEMNENLRGDEPETHISPEMHRVARAAKEEAKANMERQKAEEARILRDVERARAEERAMRASVCPDCGGELSFEGGCNICRSCGYSKCS
jgi:ribonucleoside-diphosphate reductase alpha chain